jgi:hypothetical protein
MRTPSERRLLLDATQLAVFVGMLLDLGLPWWTRTEFHETYATFTGWHSLSVSPNFGWLVIIAAVPTALAWWLRRRWLSIVAAADRDLGGPARSRHRGCPAGRRGAAQRYGVVVTPAPSTYS